MRQMKMKTMNQNLWDTEKAALREIFMIQVYLKKPENFQI